jgi:hypothetical protein
MIVCGDCNALEGQLHEFGCEMEQCPFCRHQLISCDCIYEKLGLMDRAKWTEETAFLPPEIYSEGVSDEQWQQWRLMCEQKGRWPFINYPHYCARCGQMWPEFFCVDDELWKFTIEPHERRSILCKQCLEFITVVTLRSRGNRLDEINCMTKHFREGRNPFQRRGLS